MYLHTWVQSLVVFDFNKKCTIYREQFETLFVGFKFFFYMFGFFDLVVADK